MTLRFLMAEGLASLQRVAAASAIGVGLTGIALAIVGGLAALALAYNSELEVARRSVGAEVFLTDGLPRGGPELIARELESFPEVHRARLRTRQEAATIFGSLGPGDSIRYDADLPLPQTIQVELDAEERSLAAAERLRRRTSEIRGVDEIVFPDELVRTVEERSATFLRIALVIGGVLSLSVIGVVANTSQIALLSRRSVIRTMRLMGAERRWILAPFVIQGALIGVAGGTLAGGLLYLSWLLVPAFGEYVESHSLEYLLLAFPLLGGVLAGLGSLAASTYHLRRV